MRESLKNSSTGGLYGMIEKHQMHLFNSTRLMPSTLVWPAVFLLFISACLTTVQGKDTDRSTKGLRPFYIIGHQADTLDVAKKYISSGANGVEANVNVLAGHPNVLCIGHGPSLGIGAVGGNSMPLTNFLKGLHDLALDHSNFCLVYFDCKSLAATPELGGNLLSNIRTYLVGSGADRVDMNVLISVGTLKDKAIFANIAGQLGPREGLMVDGVSNPAEVSAFFEGANVRNRAFFDGVVLFNTFLGHDQAALPSCNRASDSSSVLRFGQPAAFMSLNAFR
jgi:hypothetical protein